MSCVFILCVCIYNWFIAKSLWKAATDGFKIFRGSATDSNAIPKIIVHIIRWAIFFSFFTKCSSVYSTDQTNSKIRVGSDQIAKTQLVHSCINVLSNFSKEIDMYFQISRVCVKQFFSSTPHIQIKSMLWSAAFYCYFESKINNRVQSKKLSKLTMIFEVIQLTV